MRATRIASVDSAIASHVAGGTADATDDVGREVTLLWTVVLAVANTTTVLANLVLIVTKGTVQRSELAQLVTFVVILAFRG